MENLVRTTSFGYCVFDLIGVDRDVAMIIADALFNRLKSTNIRECVRLARLTRSESNLAKLDRIIDTFTKYAPLCSGNTDIGITDKTEKSEPPEVSKRRYR
jgi:hypothetical protein